MKKWISMIAEKMARVLKIASPLIVDPKKKVIAEVVAEVLDDDKDKKQAKARAKYILQGRNAEEVLNARPDQKLMEKVEQEIAENSDETDLLSNNSPQE